jgi:hypothetical protein
MPIVQPLKNFPQFYGTQRINTVFTRALHWSLSWASSIQSIPSHPISRRSILILSTYLCLGLPNGLFLSGFPTYILYACLFSPIHATCLAHLILRYLIILMMFCKEYKLWSSSLWSFLQSLITSSLFGTNIPLSILFSNTLSLCSSLNVRDQVLHPHRTTGKIIVLYILWRVRVYWKTRGIKHCHSKGLVLCRIWGSHTGGYEECYHVDRWKSTDVSEDHISSLCFPPAFMLVSWSAYSLILTMEAICSSERWSAFNRYTYSCISVSWNITTNDKYCNVFIYTFQHILTRHRV